MTNSAQELISNPGSFMEFTGGNIPLFSDGPDRSKAYESAVTGYGRALAEYRRSLGVDHEHPHGRPLTLLGGGALLGAE